MPSRGSHTSLYAIGRLKPAVSVMAARTEMQTNAGSDVLLVPLADRVVGDMAPTLTVLAGAVTLLLLIACVNLAVLLLNKSASRAREFSIRAAIGAGRWNLIRQLLIEQGLLVVTGGVIGAPAGADGSRHARRGRRPAGRHHARGLLPAGAVGHSRRSAGRPAVRIGERPSFSSIGAGDDLLDHAQTEEVRCFEQRWVIERQLGHLDGP
jgi:hypothetical protein